MFEVKVAIRAWRRATATAGATAGVRVDLQRVLEKSVELELRVAVVEVEAVGRHGHAAAPG